MSVGAIGSCNKQQQATMTLPITIEAIIAITNHNGCNERHHCERPKCSQDKPLKRNKEGCGNQPQSHKAALPTSATRASWGRREYDNDTHTPTIIIAAETSITATHVQQMQTAIFCQPAQEPGVVHSMQQRHLSSPSAWPTRAAQALQRRQSWQTRATTRRVSPGSRTRASSSATYMASMPITCATRATLIRATKHVNINNNLQTATKKTKPPWHVHHTSCAQWSLDKQWIELPGRASDTVSSDKRTSVSNNNKRLPFC
jgi:hypothetical protein